MILEIQKLNQTEEVQFFINRQINLAKNELENNETNEKLYIYHLMYEARKVRENAYCYYSKFQVGSVLVDQNFNTFSGVNVENSAYGDTLCGERVAIQSGITRGMKKIRYIVTQADTGTPKNPCGVCRQVIKEFGEDDTVIVFSTMDFQYNIYLLSSLLPGYEGQRIPQMIQQ